MPRKSRIDAAGAVHHHHVIARGINKADIFLDDADYKGFLNRLDSVLTRTKTACYAWALMSNHFHLLLRTGNTPVSTVPEESAIYPARGICSATGLPNI